MFLRTYTCESSKNIAFFFDISWAEKNLFANIMQISVIAGTVTYHQRPWANRGLCRLRWKEAWTGLASQAPHIFKIQWLHSQPSISKRQFASANVKVQDVKKLKQDKTLKANADVIFLRWTWLSTASWSPREDPNSWKEKMPSRASSSRLWVWRKLPNLSHKSSHLWVRPRGDRRRKTRRKIFEFSNYTKHLMEKDSAILLPSAWQKLPPCHEVMHHMKHWLSSDLVFLA